MLQQTPPLSKDHSVCSRDRHHKRSGPGRGLHPAGTLGPPGHWDLSLRGPPTCSWDEEAQLRRQRQARDPHHVGLRAEHGATFGTKLLPSARVSEVLDRLRRNDVRCRSVLGLPDLG